MKKPPLFSGCFGGTDPGFSGQAEIRTRDLSRVPGIRRSGYCLLTVNKIPYFFASLKIFLFLLLSLLNQILQSILQSMVFSLTNKGYNQNCAPLVIFLCQMLNQHRSFYLFYFVIYRCKISCQKKPAFQRVFWRNRRDSNSRPPE
jgi:hypothetical protein